MTSRTPYALTLNNAILRSAKYMSAAELEFSKRISSYEAHTFSDKHQDEITSLFEQFWRVKVGIEAVSLQCAQASLTMHHLLKEEFQIESLLTVGSVQIRGEIVCGADSHNPKLARVSRMYHVWLTLPGNVVFDISLLPSLVYLQAYPSWPTPICTSPDSEPTTVWTPTGTGLELVKFLATLS